MYGNDPDAPVYDYDPAEAERLFKETGWWDKGFTVSLVAEEDNVFDRPGADPQGRYRGAQRRSSTST